jgi:hypothetical protein
VRSANEEGIVSMDRLEYLRSYESLFAKRWIRMSAGACDDATPLAALWRTWRFAAMEVEIAFDEWRAAPESINDEAYAIYVDSLRRESEAAQRLAERYGSVRAISA